jgi:hypothetical protein
MITGVAVAGWRKVIMKRHLALLPLVILSALMLVAQSSGDVLKILTNHLGYETSGPKHAVILGKASDSVSACALKDDGTDQVILAIAPKATGPVQKWRDWYFWTLDFDSFATEGKYYLECTTNASPVRSFPFLVQSNLLERSTVSDVIYYFKDERSSGELDKADSHLHFEGTKGGTVDAHGGWWDATGDYGKHFSHLSFSTYFNPQQIPLVVYSLLKSYEQENRRALPGFARYKAHLLDEAMFGADYLVRMKVQEGSFYRSVSTGSVKQVPEERKIAGEMKHFGIEGAPGDRKSVV